MIKITKADHQSFSFAICVLRELAENTADPVKSKLIKAHAMRIRKVQLVLVQALTQPTLSFMEFLQTGISEDNPLHKTISMLISPE